MRLPYKQVAVIGIAAGLVAAAPVATQHEKPTAVRGNRTEIPTSVVEKLNKIIKPFEKKGSSNNDSHPEDKEEMRPAVVVSDPGVEEKRNDYFWTSWREVGEHPAPTSPNYSVGNRDSEGSDEHKHGNELDPNMVEVLNQRVKIGDHHSSDVETHSMLLTETSLAETLRQLKDGDSSNDKDNQGVPKRIRVRPTLAEKMNQRVHVGESDASDGENKEKSRKGFYGDPMTVEKLNQRVKIGHRDPAYYIGNQKNSNGTELDPDMIQRLATLNLLRSLYNHTTDGTDIPSRPIVFGNGTTGFLSKRAIDKKIEYFPRTDCPKRFGRGDGICINVLNATPYRLRRGYRHQYQMEKWMERWPEYIEPGQSIGHLARNGGGYYKQDCAAEVFYHFEETEKPMSISIEYRSGKEHYPYARFREELEARDLPKNSEFQIGSGGDGVGLILAGKEGDFVTNAGTEAWMRSMIDELGDLSLREIVLPRTHHAGMYKATANIIGDTDATVTQREDLYHQLRDSGARVLDVRTMKDNGRHNGDGDEYRDYHGTRIPVFEYLGTNGASFNDLIEQTNAFNDEFPGELVIWDLHADDNISKYKDDGNEIFWGPLNATSLGEVMRLLKTLKHRARLPTHEDITKIPLRSLIGGNKSAVIVRIDASWVDKMDPRDWPGRGEGFITTEHFPIMDRWSNTDSVDKMIWDQLDALNKAGVSRESPVYNMQWLLSLPGVKSVMFPHGLVRLSDFALERAFHELFEGMTEDRYPNWITLDGLKGTEVRTIAMALNKCFVARKCGDWTKRS